MLVLLPFVCFKNVAGTATAVSAFLRACLSGLSLSRVDSDNTGLFAISHGAVGGPELGSPETVSAEPSDAAYGAGAGACEVI